MKYLIIDDEHELYRLMYADVFKCPEYDTQEVSPMGKLNTFQKIVSKIHFSEKINRRVNLPLKDIWNDKYSLSNYEFKPNEKYWIIMLNGTLKKYYSKSYLQAIKEKNTNVKMCLVMYDNTTNPSSKAAMNLVDVFDIVFSFDKNDCNIYGFEHIFSTLSYPAFVTKDTKYVSDVFFVGYPGGREEILFSTMKKLLTAIQNCLFIVPGLKSGEKIPGVQYDKTISYVDELMFTYNTNCVLEVLREGQTGISLRTCEAIMFNKKLLTNNKAIMEMPFYDPRYIQVFSQAEEIDIDFVNSNVIPDYHYDGMFSPVKILQRLSEINEIKC